MFRFSRPLAIALLFLGSQLYALADEVAVLRNGFSIHCQRREQIGNITRLYTAEGYVDVPTEQIASFEVDDTPAPQETQPASEAAAAPTAQPAALRTKPDIDHVIREASARRQLDPDFVSSVIKAESDFYPRAVSPKGAQGLMQLMPGTAAKLGVSDPFDPVANVEAGTTYLSELLDRYNNDPIRALAAYNAGPERVQQYHGVPPYRETKLYIARIVRDFNAKKARQKTQVATAPAPTKRKAESSAAANKTKGAGKTSGATAKQQQAKLSLSQSSTTAK